MPYVRGPSGRFCCLSSYRLLFCFLSPFPFSSPPSPTLPLQNAGDTNYVVDMDDTRLDQEDGVLTNDVRGVIRPALKELKIAIVRRTSGLRQVRSRCLRVSNGFVPVCHSVCLSVCLPLPVLFCLRIVSAPPADLCIDRTAHGMRAETSADVPWVI